MQKTIFFGLLVSIFYPINLHVMENDADNKSDSINAVACESELMQGIRVSKNKFEQELDWATDSYEKGKKSRQETFKGAYFNFLDDLYRDKQAHEIYYVGIILNPFFDSLKISPSLFLNYCYYLKYFTLDWRKHIGQLVEYTDLLDACKKIRKGDGYSVLGAVIIAPDVSVAMKRNVIQQLLLHGFEWTEADRALAELYVYDAILVEQKAKIIETIFLLNHDICEDSLLQLLPEIRKYIIQYLVSLLDKEYGLLWAISY